MNTQYVRVYSDGDGESHFEDLDAEGSAVEFAPPAPPLNLSAFRPALQAAFFGAPAGWRGDWHASPVPVGQNMRGAIIDAEIDLVGYDGPRLCFIEVKTRASDWFAPPQANVDRRKQRHIARAACAYGGCLASSTRPTAMTL